MQALSLYDLKRASLFKGWEVGCPLSSPPYLSTVPWSKHKQQNFNLFFFLYIFLAG
jgi:hypothetical protein